MVLQYSGFAAHVTKTPMAEFLRSSSKALETMLEAYQVIGDGDAINYGTYTKEKRNGPISIGINGAWTGSSRHY